MIEAGVRTGGLRPLDRLLDSRDFRRVMRRGRRIAGRDLVVFVSETDSETLRKSNQNKYLESGPKKRLGITVSRKVGNAVVRNRFKRRVRAWFRIRREAIGTALGLDDLDLIVIARKSGGQLGLAELDERLSSLLGLSTPSS